MMKIKLDEIVEAVDDLPEWLQGSGVQAARLVAEDGSDDGEE
jgi:hypothetical protein